MQSKDIVPKDTRYVPLTQQRYCCVPTSIQMVMLRHKMPLLPAELIAHHLEVIVAPDKKKLFWNLPSKKNRPKAGWGTCVKESKTIDTMFKELKIPLKADFRLIDSFASAEELGDYLYTKMKSDGDVLVCYDYQLLFNSENSSGHVCVCDRIERKKAEVRFIDREWDVPKWRTVKLKKLFKAMQIHTSENMAGCWELVKIK